MSPFSWARWLRSLVQPKVKTYRKPACPLRLEQLETRLAPATFTWTGAGGNARWSTAGNWAGNQAPTGAATGGVFDDLVFPSTASQFTAVNDIPVANNVPATFNSITISGNGYTLSGNQVGLGSSTTSGTGSSLIIGSGLTSTTISLDILLNGTRTNQQFFTVNLGATAMLSGQLSGTGVQLTKGGEGTLNLTKDNSGFTGAITISAGVLGISNVNALGTTTAGTTVATNAQLQVSNITGNVLEPLILNGPGVGNNGALLNIAGTNLWGGNITLDTDSSIGANPASQLTVTGQISDTGAGHGLTKA